MAIIATDNGGGGDFQIVPQGTHLAICNTVVDLGKQRVEYSGESKIQHKIYIRWELPNERMEWDDRDGIHREGPMAIGKTYTLSLNERATLRGDLEAWRGRSFSKEELAGFDVANLLGKACMVTVTHAERGGRMRDNVSGVAGVPKGIERPTRTENPTLLFDADHPCYDELPPWLQKKIDEQVKDAPAAKQDLSDLDDDVPF